MSAKISQFFTLEELTVTQVRGVDNTPPPAIVKALTQTASSMDAVRKMLGKPIIVTSGYRSPAVNSKVGGAPKSAHMSGYAVDFICPQYGTTRQIVLALIASKIKFDQVIEEGNWVHISFDPKLRREALAANFGPRGTTYKAFA